MEEQPELVGASVDALLDTICTHCKTSSARVVDGPFGMHYAKLECTTCGRWMKWLPKPEADRYRRPGQHRDLVEKFGRGFCEMCLRKADQLPAAQTLIGHHVDPYAKNRDRELTREDVWILCTMCHRVVELLRTYMGHYEKDASA